MRELTVRLNPDGTFDAAHKRDALGTAYPVDASELPDLINMVNAAAIARVGVLLVEADASKVAIEKLEVELAAYKAQGIKAAQAVVAVVDNNKVDAEQTAVTCKAIALEVLAPERERQRLAALKRLAEAQLEADKFV